jgi:hypothetical protein
LASCKDGKIAKVLWDGDDGYESEIIKSHLWHLQRVSPVVKILKQIMDYNNGKKWPWKSTEAMLPILELGSQLTASEQI